jgi:hypothetical protein
MFQPVIPSAGLTGWRFLQRTYDAQFETFSNSAIVQRDTDYFREKIGQISTAEDLVADRRLLAVALGAFGLQDDLDNRYFIRKILEEGTVNEDALANKFADTRYKELSAAFGFGPTESVKTSETSFADAIVAGFQAGSFEIAAGAQDDAMRVALYAQRSLATLASSEMSDDAKWFTVLGDPPLRDLFEKALNLPGEIGQIDIDQQLGVFKDRARSVFGSSDLSLFSDDTLRQDAITKYILRNQLSNFGVGMSGQSIALMLLQR